MGLLCEFSPEDLGLPYEVGGEFDIFEVVDYTMACEAFMQTFLIVSTNLVPVDTGYLRSTLDAYYDYDFTCTAITECEYAQYVEYGTWRQAAQPYFEPALYAALEAFMVYAQEAIDIAEELVQAEMQAVMEAAFAAGDTLVGSPGSLGGTIIGGIIGIGALFLLFPIFLIGYALLRELTDPFLKDSSYYSDSNTISDAYGLDVTII